MAIPLSYNVRNLRLRKSLTIMTALGIALTVATAVFIMALLAGLGRAFATTGDPLNVLMLRKGSDSELAAGGVSRDALQVLKELPGVAKNSQRRAPGFGRGHPGGGAAAQGRDRRDQRHHPLPVSARDSRCGRRSTSPRADGSPPDSGKWWSAVRSTNASSMPTSATRCTSAKGDWPIVGIFDGSGTAHDSEIWGDINQLVTDFERTVYSSVLVRATDPVAAQALKNRANDDQRLELNGLLEPDYYASQTKSGGPIKFVGWIVAFIMAVGSCFAAANTMYAAVAYRGREIATLRVIGFSRPSILTSFMLESLLLSLLGATLGIILMLPFNGMTTGTQNQVTFSEVVFSLQMTPAVVMSAVIFALIMGVVGGFAPAWHASRRDILSALRD